MEIVNQAIEASGGQANWDSTRYVTWRNFGKRLNVWDKWTGDIRVENSMTLVLMNTNTREGRAWRYFTEITDPDDLKRTLDFGFEAWQFDSYDVFLPFMLKNEGVVVKYLDEGVIPGYPDDGEVDSLSVDILSVTFEDVGPTPAAKYHLHFDRETKLLVQWDYYMDAPDARPRFSLPWKNYKKYGGLLLSDDRGRKRHTDLAVFDELPDAILQSDDPVNFPDPALND